jgi:hypothetical protein
MFKVIGWVIGIVLFCRATVSALSIFSQLTFLVDGWTWSVDQVTISIKAIALAIGKYVSGIVGGYRGFVHGLVQMLHLPKLPQFVCDGVGVVAFSISRGIRIALGDQEDTLNSLATHMRPEIVEHLEDDSWTSELVMSGIRQ